MVIKIFHIGIGVEVWNLETNIGWHSGDGAGLLHLNLFEDNGEFFTVFDIKILKFSISIYFDKMAD